MENMIVRDWEEYIDIDIDTTGRNIVEELAPWLNEKGSLVLVEDGEDYRDEFVRQWPGFMNEDFCNKYLFENEDRALDIILTSESYGMATDRMIKEAFLEQLEADVMWNKHGELCGDNLL